MMALNTVAAGCHCPVEVEWSQCPTQLPLLNTKMLQCVSMAAFGYRIAAFGIVINGS